MTAHTTHHPTININMNQLKTRDGWWEEENIEHAMQRGKNTLSCLGIQIQGELI
jgi:hypothetical protein